MSQAPYEAVGLLLQRARARLRKTQQQIADELGKKQPQVAKWEAGEALPVTADVRDVAAAYDVKPQQLLPRAAKAS